MKNHLSTSPLRLIGLVLVIALAVSACGPFSRESKITVTMQPVDAQQDSNNADNQTAIQAGLSTESTEIVFEPADQAGQDPFSPVMLVTRATNPTSTDRDAEASSREPGLYGGSGDIGICDVDALVEFLSNNTGKAAAWADALDIPVSDITDYVGSLTPAILQTPARVTNHGYSNGQARPFQAELAIATAVLVDRQGAPRVRCACGNPLGDPQEPATRPDPTPTVTQTPGPSPTPVPEDDGPGFDDTPDPGVPEVELLDFCATWAQVRPIVSAGPGAGGLNVYLASVVAALDALIEAAEREADFPQWAMDDFNTYRNDVAYALETGDLSAGDAAAAARVEGFLSRYCGDVVKGRDNQ